MEVTNVLVHQAFQMAFVHNDHVVEQIAAAGAYPSFGHTVLPWASEAGALKLLIVATTSSLKLLPRSKIR